MLLQSLVRVLYCPVVAPLFWSSVRLSPTGPVVLWYYFIGPLMCQLDLL